MSNPMAYNISNEHLLLIDILNNMYNDNLRQINNLNSSNLEIRNLIIQILNNNTNNNTNVRRTNNRSNHRNTNTTLPSNDNLGRIILNNIPYVIESIEQVRLPTTTSGSVRNTTSQQNNEFSRILQSFFDPVDIYPSAAQIETATRCVRYCDIVSPKNISCPISLTNFNDNDMVTVIRHCGHIFNTNELSTWFRSHCNCPVCRYDIRNDNSNASSLFTSDNYNANSSASSRMNIPNNSYEILSSESNIDRTTSSIIDGVLYDFINDYTSQDLNIFDSSSNLLSSALLGLVNQMNNRSQR
jgi:hypothetical protein